ncbi:DUF29 domain-containing protein [Euhalothece natronophila Z-M001]|uniref:DUF29 domain-containing protein n=1 Tax=Euhalothece natronophila Z-M001 TaxID=522448 RepID=A0A5B8NRM8_9CHRO|nr:DUF29 family protein [Euhalothece natronophila]QDZ40730.1 DUF29 domain-containing protein [Euhalothece natronophila Z-M001]
MEELLTLRQYIQEQNYNKALELIAEMEEMSKEDKLNKIYSYAVILLLHLIKQAAEERSTRSWDFSIYNASKEIRRVNKRRQSGGYYANDTELKETLADAFDTAIKKAALEAFEGQCTEAEIADKIDSQKVLATALEYIKTEQN